MKFRLLTLALLTAATPAFADGIVCAPDASAQVKLAAKEIRRYAYLRTGTLLNIAPEADGKRVVLRLDTTLAEQEYRLKTEGDMLVISGGSPVAVLYGAYDLAGKWGVGFYLHADTVPDEKIPFALPTLDETHKPLFETRGIQPFHDFAEGPDWWTTDDYKTVMAQLAKMRMNFIGMHCYPERNTPTPEPLVWHGLPQDVAADGKVSWAHPGAWFATNLPRESWGYAPMKTGAFAGGASQLFDDDEHEPEVQRGLPFPQSVEKASELFDRVGVQLGETVSAAHTVGVKVCVGTEVPMTMPNALQKRLKAMGKDPKDPAVVREVYKGAFTWLSRTAKPDYYWLWTNENWTWRGNTQAQFDEVARDFRAAIGAWEELGKPFQLATCGWVLGPQQDRAAWSKILPPGAPIACISRQLGHEPIEPTFSNVKDRPAWAIPWVENDPNMVAYQPWAKRMRYDAADARRRGCSGLMGIHWRTSILAANLSALAQAGWDQSYAPESFFVKKPVLNTGKVARVADAKIIGAKPGEEAVYRSLRWDLDTYPVEVPDGTYTVTLKFCETHYDKPGARVFSVKVQDRVVAEKLDLVAQSGGKLHAHDLVVEKVRVSDGKLNLAFGKIADSPCLSGVSVVGTADAVNQLPARPYARHINVGGPAAGTFSADAAAGEVVAGKYRAMPVTDFYTDFARANFGKAVATEAGAILTKVDGAVEISGWDKGPGAIMPIGEPWSRARKRFAWVDDFAALRPRVTGRGELERFEQWLATFRATAAMVEVGCLRGELDRAMVAVKTAKEAAQKAEKAKGALTARLALARGWERLMSLETQTVITPGELGTIANLEQHSRLHLSFVSAHDKALAEALGAPLPPEVNPGATYDGPARLTALTRRDRIRSGEALSVPLVAPAATPVKSVVVKLRPLGSGEWKSLPVKHTGRATWNAELPSASSDFEYFVEAQTAAGETLLWPASAPEIPQTVIVE